MHTNVLVKPTKLLLALCAAALCSNAFASTCTWTGAAGSLWSAPLNWTSCGGGAPVNGDALVFPESASVKNTTHDQAAFSIAAGISFTGTTSGYILTGTPLSIGSGGINNSNTSGTNQIDLNLSLSAAQSFTGNIGTIVLNGPLNLASQTLKITWPNAGNGLPWNINSVISGAGAIEITGGTGIGLALIGDSTFSGPVDIKAGVVRIAHAHGFGVSDGSVANGTQLAADATLILASNLAMGNESLTVAVGSGQSGNGQMQFNGNSFWGGPVQLGGAGVSRIISLATNSLLTFNGQISGTGGLQIGAAPSVAVKLSNAGNNFTGTVITTGASPIQGGTIVLGGDNAVPSAATVQLIGSSTFNLNNFDDEIAGLSCNGSSRVVFGIGSALKTGGNNASTTCAGVLSATGAGGVLSKVGSGVLTLSGASTFDGEIDVLGGGLEVLGSLPVSPQNAIFVSSGQSATLFGTGSVGNVVNAGNIHGGSLSTPGKLTTEFLSFNGVGTMSAILASPINFDQLDASNVNMASNPQLNLAVLPGFVPLPGSTFKIINNRGGAGGGGTFKNLPEGATLAVNGALFMVSYIGGTGNDVVLTTLNDVLFANNFE